MLPFINQIQILNIEENNSLSTIHFLYQTRVYEFTLNTLISSDSDKIKLLNTFMEINNGMILNPLNVKSNSNYLIFKVRYKLNNIYENFFFSCCRKRQ